MHSAPEIAEGLTSASGDLLELCQADGAAVCADGQYRSIGAAPSEDAARRLVGEIRAARFPNAPWATDRLQQLTADSLDAAGCLFVPLGAPDDFVVWFRRGRPQQLRWLGDPHADSIGLINPRKSFDTWLEQVSGSSAPWTDADLQASQLLAYDVESAQLSRAQAKLAHLGLHDSLTGLPNRRHLSSVMTAMLAGATPTDPVAAIFIDLDCFKEINDGYGHEAGDCVLREAARRIAEVTRTGVDIVEAGRCGVFAAGQPGRWRIPCAAAGGRCRRRRTGCRPDPSIASRTDCTQPRPPADHQRGDWSGAGGKARRTAPFAETGGRRYVPRQAAAPTARR